MNNTNDIVMNLKNKAASSKAASEIFHYLSLRQKTHKAIRVRNLHLALVKEGFKYSTEDCRAFLKFLASVGLGKLYYRNSKIHSLVDISHTLESIGKAALGDNATIQSWHPRVRHHFLKLNAPEVRAMRPVQKAVPATNAPLVGTKITVGIEVNGKIHNIDLPKNLTMAEMAALLSKFEAMNQAKTTSSQESRASA